MAKHIKLSINWILKKIQKQVLYAVKSRAIYKILYLSFHAS